MKSNAKKSEVRLVLWIVKSFDADMDPTLSVETLK
jgi:hypothetical protein